MVLYRNLSIALDEEDVVVVDGVFPGVRVRVAFGSLLFIFPNAANLPVLLCLETITMAAAPASAAWDIITPPYRKDWEL